MKILEVVFVFFLLFKYAQQLQLGKNFALKNLLSKRGRRLNVTAIGNVERDNEIQCTGACVKNDNCHSINSKREPSGKYMCELLNASKFSNHEDLIEDADYVHWYIENICLPNPCFNGGTCTQSSFELTGFKCQCSDVKFDPTKLCSYSTNLNFALGKTTTQSTTYKTGALAVDGDFEMNFKVGDVYKCSHTNTAMPKWWKVDLGEEIPVERVVITNRIDCCQSLSDIEIKIGNGITNDGMDNPKCGDKHSVDLGQTKTITCSPPLTGRYVMVQSFHGSAMTLCEVQVYAAESL